MSTVGRKGEKEWETSFYNMEEKYRSLQKKLNEKENDLKLAKVQILKRDLKEGAGRKGNRGGKEEDASEQAMHNGDIPTNVSSKGTARVSSASPPTPRPSKAPMRLSLSQLSTSMRKPPVMHSSMNVGASPFGGSPPHQQSRRTSAGLSTSQRNRNPTAPNHQQRPSPQQQQHVAFDSWLDAGSDEAIGLGGHGAFFENHEVAKLPSGNTLKYAPASATLPGGADTIMDPLLMVWGSGSTEERINVLSSSNEKLRHLLDDAGERVKSMEHERAAMRKANDDLTQRQEESKAEIHQLVRERDLAVQKLRNAEHCIQNLEANAKAMSDDKESMRFSLEAQLRDIRSRLVSAADSNNDMTADVRTLLSELKEANSRVSTLQSKCALLETSHATQLNTNRSLVAELDSVTQQLANERRKVLSLARDVHTSSMQKDRMEDLERRIQILQQEKVAMENEQVKLMDSLIVATQRADATSRQSVKEEMTKLLTSSAYFERASKLLYREVEDLKRSHSQCRGECNEAKERRDAAESALKLARQDIALLQAKLQIVWPTHMSDTVGYEDHRAITSAYDRMKQRRAAESGAKASGANPGDVSLFLDIPLEDQVRELQQVNAAHMAELEGLRVSNQLLSEKLLDAQGACEEVRGEAKRARGAAEMVEKAAHRQVMAQSERIAFLEDQVSLMRGVRVGAEASLTDLAPGEVLIELFIGQLFASHQMHGEDIPLVFLTADFLVHETIASEVVAGQTGFLDMTATFKVQADSLLIYYLCSRGLKVQMHVVEPGQSGSSDSFRTVAEGVISLINLIADEDVLLAHRPTLRGQVKLFSTPQPSPESRSAVGAVEYAVTVRTPFSAKFVQQCRTEIPKQEPERSMIRTAHEQSLVTTEVIPLEIAESVQWAIIQLDRLQIRHEVTDVPLLSLFLTVPALGLNEQHFPPPLSSARYAIDFPSDSTVYKVRIPVPDARSLTRALAEPVVVFAFREDEDIFSDGSVLTNTSNGGDVSSSSVVSGTVKHWGVALLPWGAHLTSSATLNEWVEQQVDMLSPDGRHVATLYVKLFLESGQ